MHLTTEFQIYKQKWTELKGEINNSTITGDFNGTLSIMDRTKQKINKETEDIKQYKSTKPHRYL